MGEQLIRVAYDPQILVAQRRGGISRYFVELLTTFGAHPELGIAPSLSFRRTDNECLLSSASGRDLRPTRVLVRGSGRLVNRSTRAMRLMSRYQSGAMDRYGCDVLHATYYNPRAVGEVGSRKLAVTLVDLIPEQLGLSGVSDPHAGKAELLRQADVIFSISQATTAGLSEFYPEVKAPVYTTPRAVDRQVFTPIVDDYDRDVPAFPYVLFVGKRDGYKNFAAVVAALDLLVEHEVGLVAVGSPFTPEEEHSMARLRARVPVEVRNPDDVELAALYRSPRAFILPSVMEDFGLPVLEAMAFGCPSVLADIPVFREVGGDTAMYFAPGAPEALADSLMQVIAAWDAEAGLEALGLRNVDRFSWFRTAEVTALGYRKACLG